MMQSFLSTNYLEGSKKNILSPEEGATATLEAGVTQLQSRPWKAAQTSTATPMPLPGGVAPIMTSTAGAAKVQKAQPITIMSSKAVIEQKEAVQGAVIDLEAEKIAKAAAAKNKKVMLGGAAAVALFLVLK